MGLFRYAVLLLGGSNIAASLSPACTSKQLTTTAPYQNFWAPLTSQEVTSINTLLTSTFNLSTFGGFGSVAATNILSGLDLLPPNKTDVLVYMAGGAAPARYAFATIVFGGAAQPYLQDYIVGPLPVTKSMKVVPRQFSTRNDSKVYLNGQDREAVFTVSSTILATAKSVLKPLWGMSDTDYNNISIGGWKQPELFNDKTIYWFEFTNSPTGTSDSGTLLPTGLYVRIELSGGKSSITGWLYNNILYSSLDNFSKAINTTGFVKVGINVDGPWASTDRQGDKIPLDDQPPPEAVQPGSPRFSLDSAQNYVSWMDFSFYIAKSRDMGIKLFDIQYKGKRIIYELGMEEAMAHYASNNPIHSRTLYYDTFYAFGDSMVSLVRGYDCPTYATYLDFTVSWGFGGSFGTLTPLKDGACLFEMDTGFPIRRHTSFTSTSISKNIAFVLRSVSTIGNYDYLTTYEFAMDGSISVSMRASGYIEAAYYAHNEDYSFKIHDNLSGSMHDHVITFKADFDILGQNNSLQKIDIIPTTETYQWSDGRSTNTMKLAKSFVTSEDNSKLNWEANGATMYAIVNKDQKTSLGEYPGYRIAPGYNGIHLTVQNSTIGGSAVNQGTNHLFVTKQKDTEARASNPNNLLDINTPLVNFAKYFDGESLDQQDLVVWFNLGMHHVPHTGDLPTTMYTTAQSSVVISPLNYLPGDPSSASTQQIRINNSNRQKSVTEFGAVSSNCSIDLGQLPGVLG